MLLHTSDCTTARHVLGAVLQLTNEHELARFRMLALSDIPRDGVNGGRVPVRIEREVAAGPAGSRAPQHYPATRRGLAGYRDIRQVGLPRLR
jgi:hypothetical protein